MTQTQKIYKYLKQYGSITPLEALQEFGCMRLAARISDLRSMGVKIKAQTAHSIRSFRNGARLVITPSLSKMPPTTL